MVEIMKSLVFIVTCIGIFGFIIGGLAPELRGETEYSSPTQFGISVIDDNMTTAQQIYTPSQVDVSTIDFSEGWASLGNVVVVGGSPITFTYSGADPVYLFSVFTDDFYTGTLPDGHCFILWKKWGIYDCEAVYATYDDVIGGIQSGKNYSKVSLTITQQSMAYNIWFIPTNGNDLVTALYERENYTVTCSIDVYNSTKASQGAWGVISQLFMFQLPGIHPIVNAIIMIPFGAVIAFLLYYIIKSLIPLLGGG